MLSAIYQVSMSAGQTSREDCIINGILGAQTRPCDEARPGYYFLFALFAAFGNCFVNPVKAAIRFVYCK